MYKQREHIRIPQPPLNVSGIWATVEDVSLGGICLRVEERLTPGERYELILTDSVLHYAKDIEAEVIWYRNGRVGFKWVDLPEVKQEWLQERFLSWPAGRRLLLDRMPAKLPAGR